MGTLVFLAFFFFDLIQSADVARERINFDFAWRHYLGTPPRGQQKCNSGTKGINYGDGGKRIKNIASPGDCCLKCAAENSCGCWDWNTVSHDCWIKTNCQGKVNNTERYSGLLPTTPAWKRDYNDSDWQIIDAPHDMLIVQKYNKSANEKQAFLFRGVGWYRKHFNLPSEWKGSSIWLYIEGAFHKTTVWLNGNPLTMHKAGYTSWWIRLDNATGIAFGDEKNVLALYVDASSGTGWWYEGGGLSRHNYLVRTNLLHIEPNGAWIHTNVNANGAGAVFISSSSVVNHASASKTFQVRATIFDANKTPVGTSTSSSVTVAAGHVTNVNVNVAVTSGIELWGIQHPYLYTSSIMIVEASSIIDMINISTGVRTANFDANKGLYINGERIKMRGFCDHSNFGGVGAAVPDRVNLFRAQALRRVGGNAWRMAHNPPSPARLDFMDRLGMVAMDENRDYGGHDGQGGKTNETVADELNDMADLVKRDRSHPSVIFWSFCNEVGCRNESSAKDFRTVAKLWDPTRPVTQNHHGSKTSTQYLDVQGFSHKGTKDFTDFHTAYPKKPIVASECCSCMSQRGIDQDVCPHPKDGGCTGGPKVPEGVFYNNNIGKCTSDQVIRSDSLDYVSGTFIWSGFDYLGEARGWPQNTKCRGTVSDVAGFTKETAYWIRSWWLSNISKSDPGRPLHTEGDSPWTVFILESWLPPPDSSQSNRSIHVYSNAPSVRLELNGEIKETQYIHFFSMASFSIAYKPGNLTAVALDQKGNPVAFHSITTTGPVAAVVLSIDAPSPATGTGDAVVADGEDVAMLRATLVDAHGVMVPSADDNVTFTIVSGPGRVWATHNGDPANLSPNHAAWNPAYHGLVRAFIRTTADYSTSPDHRRRMREIDVDGGHNIKIIDPKSNAKPSPIIVKATVKGLPPSQIEIPVTIDLEQLPLPVASRSVGQRHRLL